MKDFTRKEQKANKATKESRDNNKKESTEKQ